MNNEIRLPMPIGTNVRAINAHDAEPLLQGRHLIARGMEPGKHFGTLLNEAFEAQLEGRFTNLDGALN